MIPELTESEAAIIIKKGGIIIYPTEGIYGLGCDPLNKSSVENIFKIKGRSKEKSFIILSPDIKYLIDIIHNEYCQNEQLLNKDFTTWLVPNNEKCPSWLIKNEMIAVRLTNHKTVSKLCELSQTALISTSANLSETPYDNDINKIKNIFKNKVDGIVQGKLGDEKKSSTIKNIITQETLRF